MSEERINEKEDRRAVANIGLHVVDAIMLFWHNTEPDVLLARIYSDPAPGYVEEKMLIWQQGLSRFWGQLDFDHRAKLIEAALDKYGEEAKGRVAGITNVDNMPDFIREHREETVEPQSQDQEAPVMNDECRQAIIEGIQCWGENNEVTVMLLGNPGEEYRYAAAIVGVTMDPAPAVVYTIDGIIAELVRDGMPREDAIDWYYYNIERGAPMSAAAMDAHACIFIDMPLY